MTLPCPISEVDSEIKTMQNMHIIVDEQGLSGIKESFKK